MYVIKTKRGIRIKGDRRVYVESIRALHHKFLKSQKFHVKIGIFYSLKPFYINKPTVRELESCLCATCLNIHELYRVIRQYLKDHNLPNSVTAYLTQNFECGVDQKLDFPRLDCISGVCEKCEQRDRSNLLKEMNTKPVSFYQFKRITSFFNKTGEQVEYKRTTRVDDRLPIQEIYNIFEQMARPYILHRYMVVLDKTFWNKFNASCKQSILVLDYSENIKVVPKFEAQAAHFTGRQHSLHRTVLQQTDCKHRFLYHISDDTNHDLAMTVHVRGYYS